MHIKPQIYELEKDGLVSSISISNNLIFLRLVQSFIAESAKLAGFGDEALKKFRLIAEEAFVYILKTSFDENEKGVIEIQSNIEPLYFSLSFLDKGLPFLNKLNDENIINHMELLVLKNNCDKIEWINHGKKGKEFKLTFMRPQKDIMQYELFSKETVKKPSDKFTIRRLKESEAEQVSRLIYKCYGYTYPNEDLYYPERIKQFNKTKQIISIVAFDEINRSVIGHYALENQCNGISETGQAAIDPEYRGKNLLMKMRLALEEEAKTMSIKAIISQPVTSHTRTQRINEKFGSSVCGISFGLVPKELHFRKMGVHKLSQRETCLLYFKGLTKTKRVIPDCGKHNDFIKKIYENVGLTLEIASFKEHFDSNVIETNYSSWGIGTISVKSLRSGFKEKFKDAFNKLRLTTKAEIIFAEIELNNNRVKDLIEYIESIGFFFVGILPFGGLNGDIIRFEYLNSFIDTSKIQIYGEFAKSMFEYSLKQMDKVLK